MRPAPQPATETVPNLAPMVDVIMVILVFFMLGASLQMSREGVLRTELDPRSGPAGYASIEIIPSVTIGLAAADRDTCAITVLGQPFADFDALQAYLAERIAARADPRSPLVVAAERDVRWRHVVAAMDAATQAGFENLQFAVRPRETRP